MFFGSLDRVFHNLAEPASPPCSRRPRITNGILSSVISASSRYDQKHWRLGGAQSAVAGLSAEDIDWQGKTSQTMVEPLSEPGYGRTPFWSNPFFFFGLVLPADVHRRKVSYDWRHS